MASQPNEILEHGRRQKRLQYWLAQFQNADFGPSSTGLSAVKEKLETYRLLLARRLKSTGRGDQEETEGRIQSLERELEAHFEDCRLATSSLGTANRSFDPEV